MSKNILEKLYSELQNISDYNQWHEHASLKIEKIFGAESPEYKRFEEAEFYDFDFRNGNHSYKSNAKEILGKYIKSYIENLEDFYLEKEEPKSLIFNEFVKQNWVIIFTVLVPGVFFLDYVYWWNKI